MRADRKQAKREYWRAHKTEFNAERRERYHQEQREKQAELAAILKKDAPQHSRTCPGCGETFTTSNPDRIWCAPSCCRSAHKRKIRKAKQAERAKQPEMFEKPALLARPASGPRCACGAVLYGYERGKCLRCSRAAIIRRREEKVLVTDEATRERTLRNYYKRKS